MFKYGRRQFLQATGGFTLGTLISQKETQSRVKVSSSFLELKAWTPDGFPLDKKRLDHLYFTTLEDEPIPEPPRKVEVGQLFSQIPKVPFGIVIKMPVTGFGEVYLYADNEGKGYTAADFPLDVNLTCARSRLDRVTRFIEVAKQQGIRFNSSLENRLVQAKTYLNNAEKSGILIQRIRWCNDSLRESLWAGEEAVLTEARQRITNRPDFLFGCNAFRYLTAGEAYNTYFKELFKLGTVPFYWKQFEPEPGQKNFAEIDQVVNQLNNNNIIVKGHPLVWFHEAGIPQWIEDKSFEEVRQLTYDRIIEITRHYGSKILYYDIINEPHGLGWANLFNYSFEQLFELTEIASKASRIGNVDLIRIINNCCLWGRNVAYYQPPQQTPYQYLKTCLSRNIPFEIIGLQLYYPDQDMFEINRLLEKFGQLGKPIHITESGVSSSAEVDENSYLKEARGLWHKPWDETIQADWIEQLYTLCYSKPYIEAISWWDFIDLGHFWAHGGLLKANSTPKESFYRLKNLLQQWGHLPSKMED